MVAYLLMGLWAVGLVGWKTPGLPRWLQLAGLLAHVLISMYFAFIFIHVWRMFRP